MSYEFDTDMGAHNLTLKKSANVFAGFYNLYSQNIYQGATRQGGRLSYRGHFTFVRVC